MTKKLIVALIIALATMTVFSSILPYPIFCKYTNVTEANMYEISNAKEITENGSGENEVKVLTLEWEAVNPLLEIGKTYEIYDIKTKKMFTAVRTGGTKHADIEPIDLENAKVLEEIYNGNLDWSRRAVYVKLSDYVYLSASISGYPHGDFEVENGLDGHICLHFKNSKTSNTNVIDTKHQKNIRYAQHSSKRIYEIIAH